MHPYFMKNQRAIAIQIIKKTESGEDLSYLIDNLKDLDTQEIGFVKSLCFGTIRYKIRLDYIIRKLSKIKFEKIHKDILNIMRMSLYQLIYMDHIPDSAVVNEGVKLAKKYGNKGSVSFVNGSLRNFVRNKDDFLIISSENKKEYLSLKHSFPLWIVEEIEKSYGFDEIESVLTALNQPSDFVIRVNTLKSTKDDLKYQLEARGYEVLYSKLSNDGLIIQNPRGIFDTPFYKQGLFYVQSDSSQLVGQIGVKDETFENVLDLCASPGGKITHIHQLLNGKGKFVACDITLEKTKLIEENLNRLSIENIKIVKNDATILKENWIDSFDLIVVDAPCSALGLISKFPQIKYSKSLNDIKALSVIQGLILENAEKYLKKGGKLVYSTCTFTKLENEKVISSFIENNPNIVLEGEILRINPAESSSDGFTIGVMRKNG